MKRHHALLVALVLLFLLAGCEQAGLGPAAISRDGSQLLVVSCDSFAVVEFYARVESVEPGKDSTAAIELVGDGELRAGTLIRSSSLPPGMSGDWKAVDFDTLKSVDIVFVGKGQSNGFQASFDGRGILPVSEGAWLQTNGSVTESPCPVLSRNGN